jgi:hypothetical protein
MGWKCLGRDVFEHVLEVRVFGGAGRVGGDREAIRLLEADLAYLWVSYSSPLKPKQGDGIIVGTSNLRRFEQTMEGLKAGPLPDEALKRIDHVWKMIEHDAPLDCYSDNVSLFKK